MKERKSAHPGSAVPAVRDDRRASSAASGSRAKPAAASRSPASKLARAPHFVRIIGGDWKRTRLPVADKPGLRPTPDRVRETLFNWLASLAGAGGGQLPGWHCIDAFAGTGALGLEAASRGAASVLQVEQDAALVAQLQAQKTKLGAEAVRIERGNGLSAIERALAGSQQVVFLDPPFESPDLYAPALRAARRAIAPGGVIYLEAGRRFAEDELAALGLEVFRHLKAGAVHAHLLKPAEAGLHNPPDPAAPAA